MHTTEEIIDMLKDAGFGNVEIFDDYNEKKYSNESLRAVFKQSNFKDERTKLMDYMIRAIDKSKHSDFLW